MPSTAEVCFITLVLIMLFSRISKYYFLDGDPGWHIRAGQHMLETHSIPHHDIFSFTMPHAWWVTYEWGTEVIFAALHNRFGLNGVVLFMVLVLAATYTLLYKLLRREGFPFTLSFPLLLFVILGSNFHWVARPHIVSYLFVVPCYYLLDRFTLGTIPVKRMWVLPLLMVFWVNLHAGFIAGVTLVLTFFFSAALEYLFATPERRPVLRLKVLETGGVAFTTVAASLLNPNGYKLYTYLYEYFKTVHKLNLFNEQFSPSFQWLIFHPFLAAVIAPTLLLLYSRYRLRLEEALTLVVWIALGLISLRNIPVMLLICAPIYARLLRGLGEPLREWTSPAPQLKRGLERFFRRIELVVSLERDFKRHLLSVAVLLGLCWIVAHQGYLGRERVMDFRYLKERGFPVDAIQYLKSHMPPGHVFNDSVTGGFLIYNFYPNIKVFIDGRLDMYGEEFARQFLKLIGQPEVGEGKDNWKKLFHQYQIQWVMIRPDAPLRHVVDADPDWERRYLDEECVIFVHKAARPE
ncbi:MAG: hypothetical protein LAO31_14565 [Acidobacteriia bacterium]|nr:hypothetical protein [Terriglobia bacterium]